MVNKEDGANARQEGMDISLVILVYNEAAALTELYRALAYTLAVVPARSPRCPPRVFRISIAAIPAVSALRALVYLASDIAGGFGMVACEFVASTGQGDFLLATVAYAIYSAASVDTCDRAAESPRGPVPDGELAPAPTCQVAFWATASKQVPMAGERDAQVSNERRPESAAAIRRPGGLKPSFNILSASATPFTNKPRK